MQSLRVLGQVLPQAGGCLVSLAFHPKVDDLDLLPLPLGHAPRRIVGLLHALPGLGGCAPHHPHHTQGCMSGGKALVGLDSGGQRILRAVLLGQHQVHAPDVMVSSRGG